MTTPMTPDEARLRELAEAAYHDYGLADIAIGGGMRATVSVPAFINAASPSTILALLDTLSAERERGDRAVALIERISKVRGAYGVEHVPGTEKPQMDRIADPAQLARAFLATQKAEGAET